MARDTADTANAQESATRGRGAYLPVLPEGWTYQVRLSGPEGSVILEPCEGRDGFTGAYRVNVNAAADDRPRRPRFDRPTLAEAVRDAVKSAKAVVRVGKHEAEARAARQALLEQIGEDPGPIDQDSLRRELGDAQDGEPAGTGG